MERPGRSGSRRSGSQTDESGQTRLGSEGSKEGFVSAKFYFTQKNFFCQEAEMFFYRISLPIGALLLQATENALCRIDFESETSRFSPNFPVETTPSSLLLQTETELREYFAGKRVAFSIPLAPSGSCFQKRVWNEILRVPFGETASYGAIARRLNSPGAARAVGMANHQNPIPILIPCHRIIGANGKLTGYAGGLKIKKFLLDLEERTLSRTTATPR